MLLCFCNLFNKYYLFSITKKTLNSNKTKFTLDEFINHDDGEHEDFTDSTYC